jgi:hypothetical protein
MGHGVPNDKTLAEVISWMSEDLKRRQQDAKDHPLLTVKPDEAPSRNELAGRLFDAGQQELKTPEHTWRGIVLLQGVKLRGDKSEAAGKAAKLLADIQKDEKTLKLVAEQGGTEDLRWSVAQAKSFQRAGESARALQAWQQVVENYGDTKEGKQAALEVERLKKELSSRAYLGVAFEEATNTVSDVVEKSPAEKAGIKPGDKLAQWDKKKIAAAQDIRDAVAKQKPGDKVTVTVERDGKPKQVTVELGSIPQEK